MTFEFGNDDPHLLRLPPRKFVRKLNAHENLVFYTIFGSVHIVCTPIIDHLCLQCRHLKCELTSGSSYLRNILAEIFAGF